jgi:hypothetical protein
VAFERRPVDDPKSPDRRADLRRGAKRRSRLPSHLGPDPIALEQTRVVESEGVTHLRYRVVRA